jgi:hypothetical protein
LKAQFRAPVTTLKLIMYLACLSDRATPMCSAEFCAGAIGYGVGEQPNRSIAESGQSGNRLALSGFTRIC